MDLNMKQWRFHHEQKQKQQKQQDESDLELQQHQQQQQPTGPAPSGPDSALPLFVPEITNNNNSLPLFPPPTPTPASSNTTTAKMMPINNNSSYFSMNQWQELELQALIYKHMLAGAAVPPQLIYLLNKTLLRSSHPYPPLNHPFHYHSSLLQGGAAAGHWGRPGGPMDPEPGRCRRTDGKKWRCSKDVVAAHKYCDRHMHRGRNRSRKPVESSSSSSVIASTATAATTAHLNQNRNNRRTLDVGTEENKGMFGMQNEVGVVSKELKPGGDRVLRHFFDDWPRPSLHQTENAQDTGPPPPTLSTSTNVSDFSLKLATGHEDDNNNNNNNAERDLNQLNWASGWRGAGPMGGPLAEALRSSTTDSSPTSVLHSLARNPN